MKKINLFILYLLLLQPSGLMSAQKKTSETDVRRLVECYNMMRDSSTFENQRKYFDAFPATFTEFKDVFGYEETKIIDATFGELYEEHLEYITEFFHLNEVIDSYDFSHKIINLCINGEWQADGVNHLQINVINIITSDINHDCYYNHFDVFCCYNDTLRDTLLFCLAQYSKDDILSFWQFYLDGVPIIPVDEELYNRTKYLVQKYHVLVEQLDKAYFQSTRKYEMFN